MKTRNRFRPLTRRQMLKLGAVAAAVSAVPASAQISVTIPGPKIGSPASRKPRHVLFMVSDGMSVTVPTLTEYFSHQVRGKGTRWYELLNDPEAVNGYLRTESLNSMVTDSSAASSAWASGRRIDNIALNALPDGTLLTPILIPAKQRGLFTALVTTDYMTGATPAGFAASHPSRRAYDEIARQYLNTVDILMGGGRGNFDPAVRPDKRDLIGEFRQAGYTFMEDRSAVVASKPLTKMLGLFSDKQMPYTVDHVNDPQLLAGVPTLEEMTRLTLASIQRAKKGSLSQIEGGRIDHAGHANDAAGILWDQLAFDDAVGAALDFAAGRDDTLVVITTDHATGGPSLNGMGEGYSDSTPAFQRLANCRASVGRLIELMKEAAKQTDPAAAARQTVAQWMQIELDDEQADALGRMVIGEEQSSDLSRLQRKKDTTLAQILSNYTAIGWTSANHTGEWVMLSAIGPGAERFAGIRHHTDVFGVLAELLELDVEVPAAAGA